MNRCILSESYRNQSKAPQCWNFFEIQWILLEFHRKEKEGEGLLIVVNVYVPCDPVIALDFMGTVYDKIYELMDRHEDTFLIMGGDFNACMIPSKDSINRHK